MSFWSQPIDSYVPIGIPSCELVLQRIGTPQCPTPLSLRTPQQRQRIGSDRSEDDIRNERLARLLSQITEGIICVDRNWIVTYANEEATYRSKITMADINVRTFWEVYPHLLGTDLEEAYRSVMRTGEKRIIEYYSERIDGWFNVSIYSTDDGIALFYHDITDRKGAEFLRDASIRQLRQVLETTTDAVVPSTATGTSPF